MDEQYKNRHLRVRLTSEQYERAKKLAKQQGRDLSNFMRWLLDQELERNQSDNRPAA